MAVSKQLASVIIPCFNAGRTVAQTAGSALSQDGYRAEIVVVDDGSTDNSLEVARRFEPCVRVLTGPNRGVSAARNYGIAETSGEWIVFLDADDLLVPGTLSRRLETAEASGADVIVCDWQEFVDRDRGTENGPVRSADITVLAADAEAACATRVWAPPTALMYRRSIVEKIGGFREDLPVVEDARFLFDAAHHGARFAHSPHVGACYRLSSASLSRRDPALFWRCCLLNGKQIGALWRARGALSAGRLAALAEIYNGAAHGLFRAGDPAFRESLAALRGTHLNVSGRNRLAELLCDLAGQRRAVQIAEGWTKSRHAVSAMFPSARRLSRTDIRIDRGR